MDTAGRHPIAVVVNRTGLSADLLRVWERRYSAVTPHRHANGQRLYSDADIERLQLMSSAVRNGRTIARVASLPTDELARLVAEDSAARTPVSATPADTLAMTAIETALSQARALDAGGLRDTLVRAATARGVHAFGETIAAPFMRVVGDEWHAGRLTVAQEHLATAVLHDYLLETMRGMGPRANGPRVLVATPSGERHVVGAAIFAATVAADGWDVVYLGADLPMRDIAAAAASSRADVVALSLVYVEDPAARLDEILALRRSLPNVRIVVGGAGVHALEPALSEAGVESTLRSADPSLRSA